MTQRQLLIRLAVIPLGLILIFVISIAIARADGSCTGYTVKPGDNLYRIGLNHGTTYQALAALNGLPWPYRIYTGQCLRLPTTPTPSPVVHAIKGLAMADPSHPEDLAALGASWYYTWGWNTSAGAIPMVRSMQLPPSCAPQILVGNEPNAKEPNGAPVRPQDAAVLVRAIKAQCPTSLLIVGNVSADDWSTVGGWGSGYNWLRAFLQAYPDFHDALSIHCYTQGGASYCISLLAAMRGLYAGDMWMTEGNCLSCTPSEFGRLLDYAGGAFSHVAFYTNRQPAAAYTQGWALQGADLVGQDGALTLNGQVYAAWH